MLREREGERFDAWLAHVDEQGVPELQSFANSLKKDYHRLKLIKRQMYGRGSFKMLRKRVLHRAETKRRQRRTQERLRDLGRKLGNQTVLAS